MTKSAPSTDGNDLADDMTTKEIAARLRALSELKQPANLGGKLKTFEKVSVKAPVPPSKQRRFEVMVVVRHTRSGDEQKQVLRVRDYRPGGARELALSMAEGIANQACNDYGYGSASVFRGILTLAEEAEQP